MAEQGSNLVPTNRRDQDGRQTIADARAEEGRSRTRPGQVRGLLAGLAIRSHKSRLLHAFAHSTSSVDQRGSRRNLMTDCRDHTLSESRERLQVQAARRGLTCLVSDCRFSLVRR